MGLVKLSGEASLVIDNQLFIKGTDIICPSSTLSINDETNKLKHHFESSAYIKSVTYTINQTIATSSDITVNDTTQSLIKITSSSQLKITPLGISATIRVNPKLDSTQVVYKTIKVNSSSISYPSKLIPGEGILSVTDLTKANKNGEVSTEGYFKVVKVGCHYVIGQASLVAHGEPIVSNPKAYATIRIHNLAPDYIQTLGDCVTYNGEIPEIKIPVKVGELVNIVTFEDEIEKIYNKPFSIAFSGNSIYGRLIKENEVTMTVFLKSGRVIKVRLVPYKSEFLRFVINK